MQVVLSILTVLLGAFIKLISILGQLVFILPTVWEIYKEIRSRKNGVPKDNNASTPRLDRPDKVD